MVTPLGAERVNQRDSRVSEAVTVNIAICELTIGGAASALHRRKSVCTFLAFASSNNREM